MSPSSIIDPGDSRGLTMPLSASAHLLTLFSRFPLPKPTEGSRKIL
jgi:hypothetical protein